jgi:hypothetical protein
MSIGKEGLGNLFKALSSEALGEEFNSTPIGGAAEGDEETNESNEQLNESASDNGFDDGFDMEGGLDGGDSFSDAGFGNMEGSSSGGVSGLGTSLKPTDNPFKGQNGRELLDTKLAELYISVDNSLKLIQSDIKVDKVVIAELNDLLDSIKKIREVVFIQPVETTQFRWALCAKAYQLICNQLCINAKAEKEKSKN